MIRVFVYGTLKRKQSNHYIIEATDNGKAIFIGDGTTEKKYPLVYLSQYALPFLLHVEGKGKIIHGEVFDVDEEMLKRLDYLEGHPEFYERQEIKVVVNGEKSKCWTYFLKNFNPKLLSFPFLELFDMDTLEDTDEHGHVDGLQI